MALSKSKSVSNSKIQKSDKSTSTKPQVVERKDLYPEKPRSSGRFELSWKQEKLQLTDTSLPEADGRMREIVISDDPEIRRTSEKLLQGLVEVANFRFLTFDYLLNCSEALSVVSSGLRDFFPALKTSELLQPFVDLQACMNELVIRRRPGILAHRDPLFDGGYRWLESFDEAQSAGEPYYISSSKRVLTWADMQEARIAVSYDALFNAYGSKRHKSEEANAVMRKLIEKTKIRHFHENENDLIKLEEVQDWRGRAGEKGRSAGRKYAVQVLRKKYGVLKSPDLKPELGNYEIRLSVSEATEFARNMLEEVRCLQPSKHPMPDEETIEKRRAHAEKLGMRKSKKRPQKPSK